MLYGSQGCFLYIRLAGYKRLPYCSSNICFMERVLAGKVLWSYDFEVLERTFLDNLRAGLSGVLPFHKHEGDIVLTKSALYIKGDTNLEIPLVNLEQLYMGFDDTFPAILVKTLGLVWKPLRLEFTEGYSKKTIYLIIDYYMFGSKNQLWFDTLKEIMSVLNNE